MYLYSNTKAKSSTTCGKFSCTECIYIATQKRSLQQHVASVHKGITYPCTICNYQSTQQELPHKHKVAFMNVLIIPAVNVTINQHNRCIFTNICSNSWRCWIPLHWMWLQSIEEEQSPSNGTVPYQIDKNTHVLNRNTIPVYFLHQTVFPEW